MKPIRSSAKAWKAGSSSWRRSDPGSVRSWAVIVARSGWLEPGHFPGYLRESEAPREPVITVPVGTPAAEAERQLILKTLEFVGNNKAEAARRLRLDVKTIRNKLRAMP